MNTVKAIELFGYVAGATKSRIVKCSDGEYYVVKKPDGVRDTRTLANELLASLLLKRLGISTPEPAIIDCPTDFLDEFGLTSSRCCPPLDADNTSSDDLNIGWYPGLAFGSRIELGGWRNIAYCSQFQYLPDRFLSQVTNCHEFVEILVFDIWTYATDTRQAVFVRPKPGAGFRALFIDHGNSFGGEKWQMQWLPSYACFRQHIVYDSVYGMDAFFDITDRIVHRCKLAALLEDAALIPKEWYQHDEAGLQRVIRRLVEDRRYLLLKLAKLLKSQPRLFKNWTDDWKLHPQNSFGPNCFVKVEAQAMPKRKQAIRPTSQKVSLQNVPLSSG